MPKGRSAEEIRQFVEDNKALIPFKFLKEKRICPLDGVEFEAKTKWQKFCSTACRDSYHNMVKMSNRK